MKMPFTALAVLILSLVLADAAHAQPAVTSKPARTLTEQEIKDLLVWNSPWESKATTPGQIYSFRTTFMVRRNELIAQVMRYSTSERGDSVVTMQEGRVAWQDTNGAEVVVALEDGGQLVGTAVSKSTHYAIVFKPRP